MASLSQRQRRGMDCVWCGITLTAGIAVDLGARPCRIADMTFSWYPRACRTHAEGQS
ncbi:hypothetical protein [Streptomyces sp. SYSU K217416]